jgi:hypothetical protein
LLALDQFIHAVGERDLAEHGRPIVRIQTLLFPLCPLTLLNEVDINEFVGI